MPPIPVHIDDPITPKKAGGVTPQTAAAAPLGAVGVAAPASVPATTTALAGQPQGYPPARPAQAAVPAPTPYVPAPTRTTQAQPDGPPAPQPGAVPSPYTQPAASTLPPPPRPGESVQQGTAFATALNQMHVPPPQQNYAPTHSTTTSYPPPQSSGSVPTTLNYGPVSSPTAGSPTYGDRKVSAEHPAGYVQNQYAQEMTPAQRASLDAETRRESIVAQLGLGETTRRISGEGVDVGGIWNSAKNWLGKAGEAIAESEAEVWKRINGRD